MNTECCTKCCSFFSLTGIVFLVFVGLLLDGQPLYIKGIEQEDASDIAQSCYWGAFIYFMCIVVCAAAACNDRRKKANAGFASSFGVGAGTGADASSEEEKFNIARSVQLPSTYGST